MHVHIFHSYELCNRVDAANNFFSIASHHVDIKIERSSKIPSASDFTTWN